MLSSSALCRISVPRSRRPGVADTPLVTPNSPVNSVARVGAQLGIAQALSNTSPLFANSSRTGVVGPSNVRANWFDASSPRSSEMMNNIFGRASDGFVGPVWVFDSSTRTATLVEPRTTPASKNRTLTRLFAGSKSTEVSCCMNTLNVGVAFSLIVKVTEELAAPRHAPVVESVSQIDNALSGTPNATGSTVILALAPTLNDATENAAPDCCCASKTPTPPIVAASATISAVGVADADSKRVLIPINGKGGSASLQRKSTITSVGGNSPWAVISRTKD